MPLSEALRRAYAFAHQVKAPALIEWIGNELNGYDLDAWERRTDFPVYRRPMGRLMGRYLGLEKPIQVVGAEWAGRLCRPYLPHPVAEIERDLASMNRSTVFRVDLHPANVELVQRLVGPMEPFLEYTSGALAGMLDGARTA